MKIGIIGGTFDPIHNGHLMLAEYAYRNFQLDQIWFMPNGNPPHKEQAEISTKAAQRAEMVELAIAEKKNFHMEDYEVERGEVSYTFQTMEYLKLKHPEDHLYFIIGADSLFALEQWVHPERIFPCCTILAAYRDDKNQRPEMEEKMADLKTKYGADIKLLVTPLIDLASSTLREQIRNGDSITGEVPAPVETYIQNHHLYR